MSRYKIKLLEAEHKYLLNLLNDRKDELDLQISLGALPSDKKEAVIAERKIVNKLLKSVRSNQ